MTMKLWFALGLMTFFLHSWARAESIYTTVFNVFESQRTESLLVLSGVDGRVYKIGKNKENKELMESLTGQVVKLDFQLMENEAFITAIRPADKNEVDPTIYDLNHFQYNQLREFAPTDVQSLENVTNIFKNMLNDGDKRRSECFKRAHMWAFDMWSKLGVTSQKIFIFYTKRYIMIEEFDWWFHVAPVVTGAGEDYVMDGTFMQKPITIEEWKTFFIKSDKLTCKMINKYQEYEKHPWDRLCFLMKVPMYYFRPVDIENRDKKGMKRNHWELEELQDARRAFKGWETTYEGLDNGGKTITH